jgi:hemoglobin
MRLRGMGLVLLVMGIGATIGRGDDKPLTPPGLERMELDRRIVKTVYDAASLGTEIFNKGNFEGCYRLYQGTLMAVQPLLDHRPKLAQSVKDKLDQAKAMNAVDGAFKLRAALDDIQNDIAPTTSTRIDSKTDVKPKTLWDRLGGVVGVPKIAHTILLNAIEDPKLRPKLIRADKKLDAKSFEQSLIEYISSVTGGFLPYKGKDMKAAHAGMKITDDEFNALALIVEGALKTNNVDPADIKEFMAILETTRKDIVEVKSKN